MERMARDGVLVMEGTRTLVHDGASRMEMGGACKEWTSHNMSIAGREMRVRVWSGYGAHHARALEGGALRCRALG